MTPSQEKELKYQQKFKSYQNHYMKDKNLIIECATEHKDSKIPYVLIIGVRGGKQHMQVINGRWKVI